ncbi:MAG: polysaccharide deacetylase family protein [Candidatus Hydrogenedentes bacterium]|nr:polysaccharide deacetylase family protein [Candidatus Hydrogenedentota bacterium]
MRWPATLALTVLTGLALSHTAHAADPTYAERLGWPKGTKAVIFHSDDLGMCVEGIDGTIKALEGGLCTSTSTMMPCPWVPGWNKYLKANPHVDNGLHLTLTSEWDDYRWGPLAGKPAVPGLVDEEGCLWDNVGLVNKNASADEVEMEVRAQIERAQTMGMIITHMDSHMGTLFSNPQYFERYVKTGIEKQIPILITGPDGALMKKFESEFQQLLKGMNLHEKVWEAGLPVLDDATGQSYGWKTFDEKKKMFIEILNEIQPGVTEIIVHCTLRDSHFDRISESGATRQADLDVLLDADIKKLIEEQGIVLTTWRELKERRDKVK